MQTKIQDFRSDGGPSTQSDEMCSAGLLAQCELEMSSKSVFMPVIGQLSSVKHMYLD